MLGIWTTDGKNQLRDHHESIIKLPTKAAAFLDELHQSWISLNTSVAMVTKKQQQTLKS